MTKFKFFDRNSKKFVSPFRGPSNIWDKRHELGIWNDSIPDENLKKMVDLNKKNKENFDIYIKYNNKFVSVTKELLPNKKNNRLKTGRASKPKTGRASKPKTGRASKKNNRNRCDTFKNNSHKGYEKNCVYERCKTCLKLKKGNVWDDTSYKSKNFRSLDLGPCKYNNQIVEYVDYNPQFKEMGMGGTIELKNGFPAGSKKVKKYGLKNC